MFKPKKSVVVSAGLACMLVLGTLGCSVSSESTTSTEVSVTDEDGTTTTTKTEASASASSDEGVNADASTTTATTISIADWEAAWAGTSENGYDVYYAQAPEGTNQALIAVYNPETEELLSVVGGYEMVDENALTITDINDEGLSFTFTILDQGDDYAELDLGEEFGTAKLDLCAMDELIDALKAIDDGQLFG